MTNTEFVSYIDVALSDRADGISDHDQRLLFAVRERAAARARSNIINKRPYKQPALVAVRTSNGPFRSVLHRSQDAILNEQHDESFHSGSFVDESF